MTHYAEIVSSYTLNDSTEDAIAILCAARRDLETRFGFTDTTPAEERAHHALHNAIHYLQEAS